ncbi:DHH family phosphoesterase [Candidatus Saccharibacteria bacterium]|nr:DHH family phosphoesterase [Candidatus Saccharibacteria bacterium]
MNEVVKNTPVGSTLAGQTAARTIFNNFISKYGSFVVVQAENPDGDSLGAALALESVLMEKETSLYCPVQIPKHLRYLAGWDRVSDEYNFSAQAVIIVDTASEVLLSKLLETPEIKNHLVSHPVLVVDHHVTEADLTFDHELIQGDEVSTTRVLQKLLPEVTPDVAQMLLAGTMSDTLGLTTPAVGAEDYRAVADLIDAGANVADLEEARRELAKKTPRMLDYKADLIKRVEYHLDGKLATVHIGWEEIREYSDEYNPGVLILEELRMVEGVEVAVAVKTYPDGKLTGKIRALKPIAEELAGHFGGGGHAYAAGFRVYENYEQVLRELVGAADELLED